MSRLRPIQPSDVKLPQVVEPRPTPQPQPVQPLTRAPSTALPSRRPPPVVLGRSDANPFVMSQTLHEFTQPLHSISADEMTWGLTQLYMKVEKIAQTAPSLEVRQGLMALETHIRLAEYIHKCRSTVVVD